MSHDFTRRLECKYQEQRGRLRGQVYSSAQAAGVHDGDDRECDEVPLQIEQRCLRPILYAVSFLTLLE